MWQCSVARLNASASRSWPFSAVHHTVLLVIRMTAFAHKAAGEISLAEFSRRVSALHPIVAVEVVEF